MKVVFMGTPEFAVATLDAIMEAGHEVAAVVTVPDKRSGRGLKLTPSPVKVYAEARQLPILQPEKLRSEEFLETLRAINADVFVVVAFRMLPEVVYAMPKHGTFNVHASLLPQYRGAAPIHHAVMNGETRTGVTTFFLDKQIDTGDIIGATEVPISPTETTGELYEVLMARGAELAVKTLQDIENGTIHPVKQPAIPENELKAAPKIFKEDTFINWSQPTHVIFNKIRGLCPSPGACTRIRNQKGQEEIIKIFEAEAATTEISEPALPGTISIESAKKLVIYTGNGKIFIKNLQIQGKSRLDIEAFMRGFRPENYFLTLY